MSYAEILRENRRLALLQLLNESRGGVNEHLLHRGCAQVGAGGTHDQVRADLEWLSEQGLVVLDRGQALRARLTVRGEDAALGLAVVPGLARPVPED